MFPRTELMKLMVAAAKNSLINTFADELSVGWRFAREKRKKKYRAFQLGRELFLVVVFESQKFKTLLIRVFIGGRNFWRFISGLCLFSGKVGCKMNLIAFCSFYRYIITNRNKVN